MRLRRPAASRLPPTVVVTLRSVSNWALAAALGLEAGGCSSDEAWTPVACGGDPSPNVFSAADFTRPVDYLSLYIPPQQLSPIPLERLRMFWHIGRWGSSCKTASDFSACTRKRESAEVFLDHCRTLETCGPFAVSTLGDEVGVIEARAEFLSLLGAIDNASDALALAAWDGEPPLCETEREAGTRARAVEGGWQVESELAYCTEELRRTTLILNTDGSQRSYDREELGPRRCAPGRRPAGLAAEEPRYALGSLAEFFARNAQLEAASVLAFERLARELSALAAPAALVSRAARSGLDEIRHARACTALAQRFGADTYPVRVAPLAPRTTFQIALENAVEGCVNETYSALTAQHQAACAEDPQLRAVMQTIAVDETKHAQLSFRVAAFLEPQLTLAQRLQLSAARLAALQSLACEPPAVSLKAARLIGYPSRRDAHEVLQRLTAALA